VASNKAFHAYQKILMRDTTGIIKGTKSGETFTVDLLKFYKGVQKFLSKGNTAWSDLDGLKHPVGFRKKFESYVMGGLRKELGYKSKANKIKKFLDRIQKSKQEVLALQSQFQGAIGKNLIDKKIISQHGLKKSISL
jgi:hypothetical protein